MNPSLLDLLHSPINIEMRLSTITMQDIILNPLYLLPATGSTSNKPVTFFGKI